MPSWHATESWAGAHLQLAGAEFWIDISSTDRLGVRGLRFLLSLSRSQAQLPTTFDLASHSSFTALLS